MCFRCVNDEMGQTRTIGGARGASGRKLGSGGPRTSSNPRTGFSTIESELTTEIGVGRTIANSKTGSKCLTSVASGLGTREAISLQQSSEDSFGVSEAWAPGCFPLQQVSGCAATGSGFGQQTPCWQRMAQMPLAVADAVKVAAIRRLDIRRANTFGTFLS